MYFLPFSSTKFLEAHVKPINTFLVSFELIIELSLFLAFSKHFLDEFIFVYGKGGLELRTWELLQSILDTVKIDYFYEY